MENRDVMTGIEFRAAIGKKGEKIIDWFMTQERKLFNDSIVAESQSLVDTLLESMGADVDWSIDAAHIGLEKLLTERHYENILKFRDQIPDVYKGAVELMEALKNDDFTKKIELFPVVMKIYDVLFFHRFDGS